MMDPESTRLYDAARLERPSTGSGLTVTFNGRKLYMEAWEEYLEKMFPEWKIVSLSEATS
jgi:hypothetical protein